MRTIKLFSFYFLFSFPNSGNSGINSQKYYAAMFCITVLGLTHLATDRNDSTELGIFLGMIAKGDSLFTLSNLIMFHPTF